MTEALRRLASAFDVALEYHDIWGHARRADDSALRAILAAMGVDVRGPESIATAQREIDTARWRERIAPMTVVRAHEPCGIRLHLPADALVSPLALRIVDEVGTEVTVPVDTSKLGMAEETTLDGARWCAFDVKVDVAIPLGYHDVTVHAAHGTAMAKGRLAVAPSACYRPRGLRAGGRVFGGAVQLYGVRSSRNWGIGDFTDLANLLGQWAGVGAGVVGVSPLHALFPQRPAHASPYSPSSRIFLNVLYLDVEAVPGFARYERARGLVASSAFRDELDALRATPLVDYPRVAAAKLAALEMLHAQARGDPDEHASRWKEFRTFCAARGEALRRHALFDALQEHFVRADPSIWGWPAWPAEYRNPQSDAVARFAEEHGERVEFFAWLQWQADIQRDAVAQRARRLDLAVGVYADLAVSIDRGGAESWATQDLYAAGASVGAPPDAFNVEGQDWGLPPMIPRRLREAAYEPFIATLRANMRGAGALRIDHVMGLFRLFWVPQGTKPAEGAYVRYPSDAMLGLLALESHRHRCLVIGEDLGTVPHEVRGALARNDILSYRVLLFERGTEGEFKAPKSYPEAALAVASTHDLPTLAGWWEGRDIHLRADHGQLGARPDVRAAMDERVRDRGRLLAALDREGLLPDAILLDGAAVVSLTPELCVAVQRFLARTPAALMVMQAEDVYGVTEQVNLPGTTDAHPNWRRKLPVALEAQGIDGRLRRLAACVSRERGDG
ncbi:MAG TPA: 4-alpha-glucanotransferase [Casimicrobiaceae bacterium]|nr:4-alpha-glucanotransferase [Casimicrobiaceae bacterium]